MTCLKTLLVALLLSLGAGPLAAQLSLPEEQPVRLGRYPALSPDGSRICFTYQGNLWVSPVGGGPATRLTANDSYDGSPRWSRDGKWIAFNSDREGGGQVFVIPSVGGPARQVTFHSVLTGVHDWFPDGQSLLVTTSRDTRRSSIYRLEIPTGRLKLLVTDESQCLYPALSPDGRWIAFTRGAIGDLFRKGYRGAANLDIYVAPSDGSGPARRLTDSDRNDMWPMWAPDSRTVYFTSERGGPAAVWKQPREGGAPVQVTAAAADAVRFPTLSLDGATLAFEYEQGICTAPARDSRPVAPQPVSILCRTDERGSRTSYTTFTNNNVSEFALAPDGKRMAFIVRGDLFAVSIQKGGEAKRLTDNPTRDQDVVWSPDGKTLVYASNRDGGYRLYSVDVATGETRQLTRTEGIDQDPQFSPDGKWIAFRRSPQTSLYLVRPDGTGERVAVPGPKVREYRWSPDSKWLAYVREDEIRTTDVWIVPVDEEGRAGTPVNVTDHPGFNNWPQWLPNGQKLVFRSNRYRNRDIETINHQGLFVLYSVSLEKDKEKVDEDPLAEPPKPEEMKPEKPEVRVDPHEIERRSRQVAGVSEGVGAHAVSPDSKTLVFVLRSQGQSDIWQAAAEGGSVQRLTTNGESPGGFEWAPDSSRFYFLSGGAIKWLPRGGGSGGTVGFTARMEIDRVVDYQAAFDEAWQILNDNFYDRSFHGADWKAVGARYRPLVQHCTTRRDFNYLVTQMLGELNASHLGITGGAPRPARETGYLGVWTDEEHEGQGVKVVRVMPRSPADREESRLKPGDFILSIDGMEVRPGSSYDRALAEKPGRTVTLLVNDRPDRNGARTVRLKPITRSAWYDLLYEQWIDERRAIVDRISGGRLGYLHVSDMGDTARNRFERELFSIGMRKEGMVLDFRANNGGDTHDSLLRILERRRHYFNFAPRTETPFPQPERAYTKPLILLVNEFSLSDAEVFANGFRTLGLGKIVGVPTMGWIIFTHSRSLVDGTSIRVPALGCYTLDGRDMENWGVPPDIQVVNTPADFREGRDPQLERAVEELGKR